MGQPEILPDYPPDENRAEVWDAKLGHWEYRDGCLIGSEPIRGGHLGFSPYSTALKIKDIQVRRICWKPRNQTYTPEF